MTPKKKQKRKSKPRRPRFRKQNAFTITPTPPPADKIKMIINAANNPNLLAIYTSILNPQKGTPPDDEPTGIVFTPEIRQAREERHRRLEEEGKIQMLSTTAYRKRKELSEPPNESDRLSAIARDSLTQPLDNISAEGLASSTVTLLNDINVLYGRCADIAREYGVQVSDVTAKLHALALGQR